jgi:aspartate/methionine/tyrosine aminotransferase
MTFHPFEMERWQSTWENRVRYNLSESGVHPVGLDELLTLAGTSIDDVRLGYGQSNGSDALRSRIAALYPGAADDQIMVGNGSAEANFVAAWALIQPGDEVVILTPTYMQTHGLARTFGATVREVPLRYELGWQADPDEIARVVTDRTRLVVVTNPGNPTGARLNEEVRAALVRATDRTGAWLLADEVYTGAELDCVETPSFFGAHERVLATGSLSKAYGLPGLRIGWVVSSADVAERLWARTDYTTISPGELTDRLATVALDPAVRPHLLERTRGYIRRGLDVLETWMARQGVFEHRPTEAGAICLARYDLPMASAELAERLRVDKSVLIVPGEHFGLDRHVRFGIGIEEAPLRAALDRMAEIMDGARVGPAAS